MSPVLDRPQSAILATRKALQQIIDDHPASLKAAVADEALHYGSDDPAQMFTDLSQCGCQSGLIGSLIYYHDTARFFDCHYDDIEELREEYEANTGEPLRIKGDLKNWLAWFGFEETGYQLANELGLES